MKSNIRAHLIGQRVANTSIDPCTSFIAMRNVLLAALLLGKLCLASHSHSSSESHSSSQKATESEKSSRLDRDDGADDDALQPRPVNIETSGSQSHSSPSRRQRLRAILTGGNHVYADFGSLTVSSDKVDLGKELDDLELGRVYEEKVFSSDSTNEETILGDNDETFADELVTDGLSLKFDGHIAGTSSPMRAAPRRNMILSILAGPHTWHIIRALMRRRDDVPQAGNRGEQVADIEAGDEGPETFERVQELTRTATALNAIIRRFPICCMGVPVMLCGYFTIQLAFSLLLISICLLMISTFRENAMAISLCVLSPVSIMFCGFVMVSQYTANDTCCCRVVLNDTPRRLAIRAAQRAFQNVPEDERDCSICHLSFSPHIYPCCKLPCNHIFHTHCILGWSRDANGNTCPICRAAYINR